MQVTDICNETIWICKDSAEARQAWKQHPQDRHRIWTNDEVRKYLMASPEELAAIIEKKRRKPGAY